MKKQLLSILTITSFTITLTAQNVFIPDSNFKAYLVGNTAINTNADTEIQISEAVAFTGTINCPNQSIADLTGVEQFTSLTKLYCYNNFSISSINVSTIPSLQQLYCSSNAITQLDVSANVNLTFLACDDNDLTSLNVANGNNAALINFYANNNPNLSCIQVDNALNSVTSWTNIDNTASFSENCSVGINMTTTKNEVLIYPNPSSSYLTIETSNQVKSILIYNLFGKLIKTESNTSFSVSTIPSGVYTIKVITNLGIINTLFVRE